MPRKQKAKQVAVDTALSEQIPETLVDAINQMELLTQMVAEPKDKGYRVNLLLTDRFIIVNSHLQLTRRKAVGILTTIFLLLVAFLKELLELSSHLHLFS